MNSKLENKLKLYEQRTPITNDEDLISAIETILDSEESLPYEDRDYDLIEEATEAILSLQGVDMAQLDRDAEKLREEFYESIENQKSFAKKTSARRSVNKRWIIPLVAVISVIATLTLVVAACGYNFDEIFLWLKEKISFEDGRDEYIKTEDCRTYDSFDSFLNDEIASEILLPYAMFDELTVETIRISNFGTYQNVSMLIEIGGVVQQIDINTPCSSDYDFSNKTVQIGDYQVWCVEYDTTFHGVFEHEGNQYEIISSSYENLEAIIKNMEKQ